MRLPVILARALAAGAVAALAAAAGPMSAQQVKPGETEARYLGGYDPRACGYPRAARSAALSGCCQMDLSIDAKGRVVKAEGECSDPIFLEPTKRCLSFQAFMPATRYGQPIASVHHLEYEWRASIPSKENLCHKLKTS